MKEKTVCIIKPEGLMFCHEIWRVIAQVCGLSMAEPRRCVLPVWALEELYPDLAKEKGELWIATLDHLSHSESEIMTIEGEDAISVILDQCGHDTVPAKCAEGTFRRRFGGKDPCFYGKKQYWRNIVHRPKNKEEAERDLAVVARI